MTQRIYGKKQHDAFIFSENGKMYCPDVTYAWQKDDKGKDYLVFCDIDTGFLPKTAKQYVVNYIQQKNIALTKEAAQKLNLQEPYPDYVIQKKLDWADEKEPSFPQRVAQQQNGQGNTRTL